MLIIYNIIPEYIWFTESQTNMTNFTKNLNFNSYDMKDTDWK